MICISNEDALEAGAAGRGVSWPTLQLHATGQPRNTRVSVKDPSLPFQQCGVAIKVPIVTKIDPLSRLAPGDVKCVWKGVGQSSAHDGTGHCPLQGGKPPRLFVNTALAEPSGMEERKTNASHSLQMGEPTST